MYCHTPNPVKRKALWVPVSVHHRGKHKKHAISYNVHSVDELKLRHHSQRIETGLQNLSLNDHKKTSTPLPAKPPTAAAASPPAPRQYRPDGAAYPLPRQQHGPEVLHGTRRATHSTSILKSKPVIRRTRGRKARPKTYVIVDQYRSVQGSGWRSASPVSTHEGRTDWLLSPTATATSRRPAVVGCCCCVCVCVCVCCCVCMLLLLCVVCCVCCCCCCSEDAMSVCISTAPQS